MQYVLWESSSISLSTDRANSYTVPKLLHGVRVRNRTRQPTEISHGSSSTSRRTKHRLDWRWWILQKSGTVQKRCGGHDAWPQEEGSASVHAGIPHPPPEQTPPLPADGYVADGTHPTGMHSCWWILPEKLNTGLSIVPISERFASNSFTSSFPWLVLQFQRYDEQLNSWSVNGDS